MPSRGFVLAALLLAASPAFSADKPKGKTAAGRKASASQAQPPKPLPPGKLSAPQTVTRVEEAAKAVRGGPGGRLIPIFSQKILADRTIAEQGVGPEHVDNFVLATMKWHQSRREVKEYPPGKELEAVARAGQLQRDAEDLIKKTGPLEPLFRESLEELKAQIRPGPGGAGGAANPSVVYLMAVLNAADAAAAGDERGAWLGYSLALAADPGGVEALSGRSSALLRLGRYEDANRDARQALELDPDDRNAFTVMKFSEGRTSAAGGAPAPGSAPSPESVSGLFGAGRRAKPAAGGLEAAGFSGRAGEESVRRAKDALRLGDAASAQEELSRALARDPRNVSALALRSIARSRRGDFSGALADAGTGLTLDPKSKVLLNAKAYAQVRGSLWRDALGTANAMLELDPDDPYAYAYRAHAYGEMGDRDAMLSDIRRAAALDPRFADAAKAAGALRLPAESDILFLFPGEFPSTRAAVPAAGEGASRARRFGWVVGLAVLGGLLLALLLLREAPKPEDASTAS